jgi:UDP-N-acetyl-D-galactosamine dehydrogenase
MGKFVAENVVKLMIKEGKQILDSKVLIMGLTFKENIKDIRNTKVIDIYNELNSYGVKTFIHDPYAIPDEVEKEYGIKLLQDIKEQAPYDAIIVAVKHEPYRNLKFADFKEMANGKPIIADVKGIYDRNEFKDAILWRL